MLPSFRRIVHYIIILYINRLTKPNYLLQIQNKLTDITWASFKDKDLILKI